MSNRKGLKAVFVNKGQRFDGNVVSMKDFKAKRLVDQPEPRTFMGLQAIFTDHEPDPKGAA